MAEQNKLRITGMPSLGTIILVTLIIIKVISLYNPSFHFMAWYAIFLWSGGIQIFAMLWDKIYVGLGEKIGAAIYFRRLARIQAAELKKGAEAAKSYQAESIAKSMSHDYTPSEYKKMQEEAAAEKRKNDWIKNKK